MFASQVAGIPRRRSARHRPAPTRRTTSSRAIRCTATSADLAALAKEHPALRNGAHQDRYASDGPGSTRSPGCTASEQREYVVALNNSESEKTAAIPTYLRNGDFSRIYGSGAEQLTSNGGRLLSVTVPALSTVVYESAQRIPRSECSAADLAGRASDLGRDQLPDAGVGRRRRLLVQRGDLLRQGRQWRAGSPSAPTTPGRTGCSTTSAPSRTASGSAYRAVVRDNAGHQRDQREAQRAVVPAPKLTIELPAEGASVFGKIEVRVTRRSRARPAMWSGSSGSLNGTALGRRWTTDSSSPVYTYSTTCRRCRSAPPSVPGDPEGAGRHPGGQPGPHA